MESCTCDGKGDASIIAQQPVISDRTANTDIYQNNQKFAQELIGTRLYFFLEPTLKSCKSVGRYKSKVVLSV